MTATARQTANGSWVYLIDNERRLSSEAAARYAVQVELERARGRAFVRWLWAVVCVFGALVVWAVSL